MRILLLTHAFNCLAQRLFCELSERGHTLSVELDIHERISIEAAAMFRPEIIIAPYLKRAIPRALWGHIPCFIVHPGIAGDRGPSSLDWAVLDGRLRWGVTVLQANEGMDAGDIWATVEFPMRIAPKSSLYRREVTDAACNAVLHAVTRYAHGEAPLIQSEENGIRIAPRRLMSQSDRRIDWRKDNADMVIRKLNASDGSPGVADLIDGHIYHLYDAQRYEAEGIPGSIIGRAGRSIVRAVHDGAVSVGVLRDKAGLNIKLPAVHTLPRAQELPELPERRVIRTEFRGGVVVLTWDIYNGAMDTGTCRELINALERINDHARGRGTKVLLILGGEDIWSNGIHLHMIEAAESPADASLANIEAMNDLVHAVITAPLISIAALQGNAGAGGCTLAFAADIVYARSSVILNPHYRTMGDLYGSEYWTYLFSRRAGEEKARAIYERRLPISATQARKIGLVDACMDMGHADFRSCAVERAEAIAASQSYAAIFREKQRKRNEDEIKKPLQSYRNEEMKEMERNFFGCDPSYHIARYNFVHRVPNSRTPRHLAVHRIRT